VPASFEGIIELSMPLAELPLGRKSGRNLDRKAREALEALKLVTVGDLLRHYPRRYEDRVSFATRTG
jgi:RecG-like helicase